MLLLLVLMSLVARAQDCPDPVAARDAARDALLQRKSSEVRAHLDRFDEGLRCWSVPKPELLASRWIVEGVWRQVGGDPRGAATVFQAAHRVAPDHWEERFGSGMHDVYKNAVAVVVPQGTLELQPANPGVAVYVDGEPIYSNSLKVDAGVHLLQIGDTAETPGVVHGEMVVVPENETAVFSMVAWVPAPTVADGSRGAAAGRSGRAPRRVREPKPEREPKAEREPKPKETKPERVPRDRPGVDWRWTPVAWVGMGAVHTPGFSFVSGDGVPLSTEPVTGISNAIGGAVLLGGDSWGAGLTVEGWRLLPREVRESGDAVTRQGNATVGGVAAMMPGRWLLALGPCVGLGRMDVVPSAVTDTNGGLEPEELGEVTEQSIPTDLMRAGAELRIGWGDEGMWGLGPMLGVQVLRGNTTTTVNAVLSAAWQGGRS